MAGRVDTIPGVGAFEQLLDAAIGAATVAVPALIGAAAGCAGYWFRLRKARLRAERMMLPPSSEPPRPSWWKSFRPPRRRELEPREPDPELTEEIERQARGVSGVDDWPEEKTPPRGRRPRRPPPEVQ